MDKHLERDVGLLLDFRDGSPHHPSVLSVVERLRDACIALEAENAILRPENEKLKTAAEEAKLLPVLLQQVDEFRKQTVELQAQGIKMAKTWKEKAEAAEARANEAERLRDEWKGRHLARLEASEKASRVRVAVRFGWEDAGKQGTALGPPVFAGQAWTPVLWDGDEDPDFHKTAGLLVLEEGGMT